MERAINRAKSPETGSSRKGAAAFLHPQVGAFCQRDPLGYDQEANFYDYLMHNPIIMVDPNGLKASVAPNNTVLYNYSNYPIEIVGDYRWYQKGNDSWYPYSKDKVWGLEGKGYKRKLTPDGDDWSMWGIVPPHSDSVTERLFGIDGFTDFMIVDVDYVVNAGGATIYSDKDCKKEAKYEDLHKKGGYAESFSKGEEGVKVSDSIKGRTVIKVWPCCDGIPGVWLEQRTGEPDYVPGDWKPGEPKPPSTGPAPIK
jgi:RHS repeat-associated protein